MDFIKAYSSALSSESSKSDRKHDTKVSDNISSTVKSTAQKSKMETNYTPYQPKNPSPNPAKPAQPDQSITASQLQTNPIPKQTSQTQNFGSNNSFTQLFDDAMYVFRKNVVQAIELGITEQIANERSTLTRDIVSLQNRLASSESDNANLRNSNENFQLEITKKNEYLSKMASQLYELRTWRKDSLYGQKVLRAWNTVARHGQRCGIFENLIQDQQNLRRQKELFLKWKSQTFKNKFGVLQEQFQSEISKMAEEREAYFVNERRKYENQIEMLKKEMSTFAVKERKMKDAMKHAFLKGINAISEEATIAMDRSEKYSMPAPMQQMLERTFVDNGGDVNKINEFSDDGEDMRKNGVPQPYGGERGEKSDRSEHQQQQYFSGFDDEIEEQNIQANVKIQQQVQFDHLIQQPMYVASPARPVARHDVSGLDNDRTLSLGKIQDSHKQVPVKSYKAGGAANISQPNLAQRLKNASNTKPHPSSMIYKESIKQMGKKITVEKE
ncbi:hypothetical protein SS50377_24342 [Spironucleus salmonicida]|uniref:Protein of centriole 5 n=1 Tax=Spironucleus salmonicida TaxID=348837 RepID=V6LQX6_9EUKA|nr:hypothetical protein SS50377_24342 [Spironucleus salmonicida]|eukprot:EST46106.1 hypothetical protein SS50377_14100 [Spironucleus salmonicida]